MVVGLDLATGRRVHVADADLSEHRRRGYSGDRTLVCALCYLGCGTPAGTRVPLVVRGRVGGQRRAHFAHPAASSPVSGPHRPESVWHLHAKHTIAAWLDSHPVVAEVAVEQNLLGGDRRADVYARLRDGATLAFEAQYSPLSDADWRCRHHSYRRAQLVDVWLWHPHPAHAGIVLADAQPLWLFDADRAELMVPVARPHERLAAWWESENLSVYAPHWPPCVGDEVTCHALPLSGVVLSAAGLDLPASWHRRLTWHGERVEAEARQACKESERRRVRLEQLRAAAQSAAKRRRARGSRQQCPPEQQKPRCSVCAEALDEIWWGLGYHGAGFCRPPRRSPIIGPEAHGH